MSSSVCMYVYLLVGRWVGLVGWVGYHLMLGFWAELDNIYHVCCYNSCHANSVMDFGPYGNFVFTTLHLRSIPD
jgi:hypothetical protein